MSGDTASPGFSFPRSRRIVECETELDVPIGFPSVPFNRASQALNQIQPINRFVASSGPLRPSASSQTPLAIPARPLPSTRMRTCCRRRSGARRIGWMRCLGEVAAGWPGQSRREFHAHSGENSRGKVQNVVVKHRAASLRNQGVVKQHARREMTMKPAEIAEASRSGSGHWKARNPGCIHPVVRLAAWTAFPAENTA